jgi:hypothetical protein
MRVFLPGRGTRRSLVEGGLRPAPAPLHHAATRRGHAQVQAAPGSLGIPRPGEDL